MLAMGLWLSGIVLILSLDQSFDGRDIGVKAFAIRRYSMRKNNYTSLERLVSEGCIAPISYITVRIGEVTGHITDWTKKNSDRKRITNVSRR